MPNYDWQCVSCDKNFERVAPSDVKFIDCPLCYEELGAHRLQSAPSFTVKGGTPKFHNTGRTK